MIKEHPTENRMASKPSVARSRGRLAFSLSIVLPIRDISVTTTKENESSWIFEQGLSWANTLQRVQRSAFSLGN